MEEVGLVLSGPETNKGSSDQDTSCDLLLSQQEESDVWSVCEDVILTADSAACWTHIVSIGVDTEAA